MYSRIVVGTDGTDRSLIAVDHAAVWRPCARPNCMWWPQRPHEAVGGASQLRTSSPGVDVSAVLRKIGHDATKRHGSASSSTRGPASRRPSDGSR